MFLVCAQDEPGRVNERWGTWQSFKCGGLLLRGAAGSSSSSSSSSAASVLASLREIEPYERVGRFDISSYRPRMEPETPYPMPTALGLFAHVAAETVTTVKSAARGPFWKPVVSSSPASSHLAQNANSPAATRLILVSNQSEIKVVRSGYLRAFRGGGRRR